MRAVCFITFLAHVATACDTREAILRDMATPFNSHGGLGSVAESVAAERERLSRQGKEYTAVPVTLLEQDVGDLSPACLDGSPYGFYFVPSQTGSKKWTISIEGGGWCYDETSCFSRSKTRLGSSKYWPAELGCQCMNADANGPIDDCNCIHMPYGDGASFSGYRADPWPVPGTNGTATLTFRGIKNIDATIEWALEHGLKEATEFVLTGGSAGGLSTFLHSDRVANKIRAANPSISKIRSAPVVGYFLDHDNFKHTHGLPNTPSWKQENYTYWMKYIYHMQNLTFGADGGLSAACRNKHPSSPWLCFMSPHMQDTIETPFFMFNSKYDAWQLINELQAKWAGNPDAESAVIKYGRDFMQDFKPVTAGKKNGAFITSCICHGCGWSVNASEPGTLALNGTSPWQAYANWYNGVDEGEDAIHIDPRLPNGGGAIASSTCQPF